MSEREQNPRVRYAHEHVYVYEFEVDNHKSWSGKSTSTMEYALCTNITGPMAKENKKLLEAMLRIIYGYYPKSIRFKYDRNEQSRSYRQY